MQARKMSKRYCWWQSTKTGQREAEARARVVIGTLSRSLSCGQGQPENSVEDPLEGPEPGGRESNTESLAFGALPPSGDSLSPLNAFLR